MLKFIKKKILISSNKQFYKKHPDYINSGGFLYRGKRFTEIRMVKPDKGFTKAGRLSLFAYMDGKPVKIYECNNEEHANYIKIISSRFSTYFPDVYLRVGKYLVTEWVDGVQLRNNKIGIGLLKHVAKLQAKLHAYIYSEKDDVGFDYIQFLFDRLNKYKGFFPLVDELNCIKTSLNEGHIQNSAVSHPDITIQNLIKNKATSFKIIDNELLTHNSYFQIDLFNTLNSISCENYSEIYLHSYKESGGDLTQILNNSKYYSCIWKLRILGSCAQAGNYQKMEKLNKMEAEKISEPILKCIDKCN
jgi:hypothetical protein